MHTVHVIFSKTLKTAVPISGRVEVYNDMKRDIQLGCIINF